MRSLLYIISLVLLFISYDNISSSIIYQIIPIFLFLVVIINEVLIEKKIINILDRRIIIQTFFILVIVTGVITSYREDTTFIYKIFKSLSLVLAILATTIIMFNTRFKNKLDVFVKLFYTPFLVYLILNLSSYFLIGSAKDLSQGTQAVMFSYLGVNTSRVHFLLSVGVNAYGSLVGILLTLSLIGLNVIKKYKSFFFTGIIISVITLLFTDSRGPLIYGILVFLIIKIYYANTSKPRFIYFIPLIGFFGPFLLLTILSILSTTSYGELLSRSSEDLASGNSRLTIWSIAVSDFLTFKPENHIFGYGEYGHHTSGLSPLWGFIFGNEQKDDFMHPHNTFLSILFDYGYFGLFIYLVFQYSIAKVIKEKWNEYRDISIILLSNMLYFSLVGIGETMFGFYYKNIIYVFFIINIFAFILKFEKSKKTRYS